MRREAKQDVKPKAKQETKPKNVVKRKVNRKAKLMKGGVEPFTIIIAVITALSVATTMTIILIAMWDRIKPGLKGCMTCFSGLAFRFKRTFCVRRVVGLSEDAMRSHFLTLFRASMSAMFGVDFSRFGDDTILPLYSFVKDKIVGPNGDASVMLDEMRKRDWVDLVNIGLDQRVTLVVNPGDSPMQIGVNNDDALYQFSQQLAIFLRESGWAGTNTITPILEREVESITARMSPDGDIEVTTNTGQVILETSCGEILEGGWKEKRGQDSLQEDAEYVMVLGRRRKVFKVEGKKHVMVMKKPMLLSEARQAQAKQSEARQAQAKQSDAKQAKTM